MAGLGCAAAMLGRAVAALGCARGRRHCGPPNGVAMLGCVRGVPLWAARWSGRSATQWGSCAGKVLGCTMGRLGGKARLWGGAAGGWQGKGGAVRAA